MSHRKLISVVVGGLLLSSGAYAQTVYNSDGSRSMLGPNPTDAEAAQVAPSRAQPAGAQPAVAQPAVAQPAGGEAGVAQATEERFDIDCDPDIDVCVDPNPPPTFDDGYDPNAYQQFESALSPYGNWSQDPTYGQVWTPSPDVVGADFMPYSTGGEWLATNDYGFAWSSDYDWGWAPFHYGRWLFLAGCGGWSWIPGSVWGPAWVDWRYGGGYAGWAPLPPHGVIIPAPAAIGARSPWRFVVASELTRRNPAIVPSKVAPSVFARTAPVSNLRTMTLGGVTTRITLGPPLSTVSRDLGRSLPALTLKATAPSVLPRQQIVARPGISLGQRQYVQSAGIGMRVPGGYTNRSVSSTPPAYHAPSTSAPPTYQYGSVQSPPAYRYSTPPPTQYRGPTQGYSPPQQYRAPSYSPQPYRAPSYSAPQYRAPSYSAPQQYRAPSYSAPSYSAPRSGPSYSAPSYSAPRSAPSSPMPSSRPSFSPPSRSFGGPTRRF